MSSDEAEAPTRTGWKKRRLQGACDACRRKKVKCDSANKNGKQCTNCLAFGIECTHSEPVKKRGPKSAYVEGLEKRLRNMEDMLRKFDINIEGLNDSQQSSSQIISSNSSPSYSGVPSSISSNPGYPSLSAESSNSEAQGQDQSEEEEDFAHVALADHLSKLSLNAVQHRFFGPSSAFMIMKNAHKIKEQTLGHETRPVKRPQYWGIQAWEKEFTDREIPLYIFPEDDLMFSLISLYFEEVNIFLPILHRPSFTQSVSQGLHYRDPHFGATLLLVCAVASRYSKDPRVLAHPGSELSCGWNYYEQVQTVRKSLFEPPTLSELQFYCLATIYMLGTSSPSSGWALVSIGVRFALEIGVHRRQPDSYRWTSSDEQKRRAFWVLVSLDRLLSSFVGRPASVRDEDFDVEPPLDCDDEYWEDPNYPERSFRQPDNKPSIISCFKSHLRLVEILAFSLRTLYSSRRSKLLLGLVGEEWDQKILRELDSALNKWFLSVPEHLRWNPHNQNPVYYRQSVFLYSMFYLVQIQSHRPFLQKASEKSFHSLAICTNAARSTIHILDGHVSRGIIGLPHILYASFISAMVIMLNLWGSKRAGIRIDHQKEIENASKIMKILHQCDQRWNIAGRFWDMLSELVRDFEVLDQRQTSNKQSHNSDHPLSFTTPGPAQQPQNSTSFQPQSHSTSYGNQIPSTYATQSQSNSYPSQSYSARSTQYDSHSSVPISADSQLASQLMYGWKLSPENSPAWTNQQAVESLATIDKKTIAYLEQIFGRIDNLPQGHDPAVSTYHDVAHGSYLGSDQGYTAYPSQLQTGYDRPMLDISGQSDDLWASGPSGSDFNSWTHYVESMGLSNVVGTYQ